MSMTTRKILVCKVVWSEMIFATTSTKHGARRRRWIAERICAEAAECRLFRAHIARIINHFTTSQHKANIVFTWKFFNKIQECSRLSQRRIFYFVFALIAFRKLSSTSFALLSSWKFRSPLQEIHSRSKESKLKISKSTWKATLEEIFRSLV